ncbi:hypothetical protein F5Y07DRAFT_125902 [Xylaria sp. FL0933]|nr:hypothetical protein F5Y07DRAFT_125902 [Xylaria sp. FL0933]
MAFSSFGNAGAANVSQGPALPEVQTEGLGFLSLAGDAKLRLSTPWSPPPAPNASLLSIASRKGLVAAACPDGVVVASTEAVRKAFEGPKNGDSETRSFTPQLQIPLPMRICQLAFSADEAYLILSAEQGGGLAVYDVGAFQQGSTRSAFEIPTNGESLRALVPNPRPEKAELCAVVTNEGKLLMANLKERNFTFKGSSQILREQVSCVAWSNKGKQLVAGIGDGTMCQLTPEGDVKAEIPRPPELDSSYYVSAVVWLENDLFLVFHVSTSNGTQTKCHMITRQGQNFQYQGLNDPVDPYAAEKVPHHTAVRLKDFPPNLQDLLIFSSSAVPDIGLLARSKTPLSPGGPVNVFANVELADDSRRAALPMGEDLENLETPAVIGVALDLSSKDKVYKPIPTDEQDLSPGPLPGYWALNEQGILSIWWVVYSESIREGTTYPGLAAVEAGNAGSASSTPAPLTIQSAPSAVPSSSPFGSASASTGPAFGGPSALGARSSPWGNASATTNSTGGNAFGSSSFGSGNTSKPVFGSSSFGMNNTASATPAFGQSTGLGAKTSVWGPGGASTGTPAFGQVGFNNSSSGTSSPFGSAAGNNAFSSFAKQGGFAALGSTASADKPSIFTSANTGTAEPSMDTDTNTSFPPPSSKLDTAPRNPFGSQPFKLESSFKPDSNAEDPNAKKSADAEKSIFGTGFTSSISEATKATSTSFGGGQGLFGKPPSSTNVESTTPTSTPSANKFFSQISSQPANSGPFSLPSSSSGGIFGKASSQSSAVQAPQPQQVAPAEAPLPPEPTMSSTASKPAGDAPLPPDPVKEPKAYQNKLSVLPIGNQFSSVTSGFKFPTSLPPVSDSEDDDQADEDTEASEGSGVDVAKDFSPSSTGANRTPGYTPQGSFDGGLGGSYSNISRPEPDRRSLFLSHNGPIFPQPNPRPRHGLTNT